MTSDMALMMNNKVHIDYRKNILIDQENPVLAFKANRDRYVQTKNQMNYAGLPQLGSINSEDAITWNIFRSLSISNNFNPLEKLFNRKLDNPKILLWTLSFDQISHDLQYTVGSIIRQIDGRHQGQMTEPDVIIESDDSLYIIECKLGEYGKYPDHLWGVLKNSDGPKARKNDYFIDNIFINDIGYDSNMYQLYRMVFYANKIGQTLMKKPVFVSLVNKSWWQVKRKGTLSPDQIWNDFIKSVNEHSVELINVFWQDLQIKADKTLGSYIQNHKCLTNKLHSPLPGNIQTPN